VPRLTRRSLLTTATATTLLALAGCASGPKPSSTAHADATHLPAYERPIADLAAVTYPDYVKTTAVRDGYAFALARPDVLKVLPCYCGCGLNAGHRSNLDCFIAGLDAKGAVVFDEHASYCQTCLDIAADAKTMVVAGKPLSEIRAYVDSRHGGKGPGTDTPLPTVGS
jgi:hypothetical protein